MSLFFGVIFSGSFITGEETNQDKEEEAEEVEVFVAVTILCVCKKEDCVRDDNVEFT